MTGSSGRDPNSCLRPESGPIGLFAPVEALVRHVLGLNGFEQVYVEALPWPVGDLGTLLSLPRLRATVETLWSATGAVKMRRPESFKSVRRTSVRCTSQVSGG